MKTAIIYYSEHHGNTRKLLDAICAADKDAELVGGLAKGHPTEEEVSAAVKFYQELA